MQVATLPACFYPRKSMSNEQWRIYERSSSKCLGPFPFCPSPHSAHTRRIWGVKKKDMVICNIDRSIGQNGGCRARSFGSIKREKIKISKFFSRSSLSFPSRRPPDFIFLLVAFKNSIRKRNSRCPCTTHKRAARASAGRLRRK